MLYRFFLLNKKQITTINGINKSDNKCVRNAVTFASNHQETGIYLENITKNKAFIGNW